MVLNVLMSLITSTSSPKMYLLGWSGKDIFPTNFPHTFHLSFLILISYRFIQKTFNELRIFFSKIFTLLTEYMSLPCGRISSSLFHERHHIQSDYMQCLYFSLTGIQRFVLSSFSHHVYKNKWVYGLDLLLIKWLQTIIATLSSYTNILPYRYVLRLQKKL